MHTMELSAADWLSLGALSVSCISALLAWRGLQYSREALALSKQDQEQKSLAVEVYLIDSCRVRLPNGDVFANFNLSYKNLANAPHTIANIELIVSFSDESGGVRQTHFQSNDSVVFLEPEEKIQALEKPLNILPRSTVDGWISYKLLKAVREKRINQYEIVGLTSDGQKISVKSYLLMDKLCKK